jgi:hypothetical protein
MMREVKERGEGGRERNKDEDKNSDILYLLYKSAIHEIENCILFSVLGKAS